MRTERLELDAARRVLGLLLSTDLSRIAALALEDDCDSASLRRLAGMDATEADNAPAIFDRALIELGIQIPTKRQAVVRLAREIARTLLGGAIAPHECAKQIWNLSLLAPDENLSELDSFVYAASEWEDRPEHQLVFEKAIEAAARDLVSLTGM